MTTRGCSREETTAEVRVSSGQSGEHAAAGGAAVEVTWFTTSSQFVLRRRQIAVGVTFTWGLEPQQVLQRYR